MSAVDQPSRLRADYRVETTPVIRQRFAAAVGVFVVFMGIGAFVEARYYPHRGAQSYLLWAYEAVVGILGAAAGSLPVLRARARVVGVATTTGIIALVCTYHASVAASAERLAIILGCMLNLTGVVVPWGWVPQTLTALGTLASFAVGGPHLVATESITFPAVVLAAAATTSVCAAVFLDQHRFEAFRRTALQTEEAEIAAALAHVTETLSRSLGDDCLLHEVTWLALGTLDCDFSTLFLHDERRGVFWMASTAGGQLEVIDDLAALEFAPATLPLLARLEAGTPIEIAEPDAQDLVPPALLRRLRTSAVLFAAIARAGRTIGVLAVGYHSSSGPFSSRQRRLALGIANATAIALENMRLVADLQAANRLKSEFVATMSHELRTPLNVIMGYTQMLAEGAIARDDEAGFLGTLDRIQLSAHELLELITATLDMGRLESGRETVSLGPVDVAALVSEVVGESWPLVRAGISLHWRSELAAEPVITDQAKLKTVLKNLVGNALKFTSRGSVEIVARAADGRLAIDVRDTGIGIAREQLPAIFEMFRQLDSSSTRRYGGVGLGLHIARRLVDLLGGEIGVESTVGAGSTFTVLLPLRFAGAAARPDAA